jgi:hypothetical protein
MLKTIRSVDLICRSMACAAIFCAGAAVMSAQTVAQAVAPSSSTVRAQPPLQIETPAINTSSDALFSSSSAENTAASSATGTENVASLHALPVNFDKEMQYGGGRRRYGSPRYRGGNTNADGSSKYIFFAGGGFSQPLGNTFKYYTPSWGLQVGGGRQFSKHLAVPIQFDYDNLGLTGQNLGDQSYIYSGDSNAGDNGIDANAHVWSFSVDPTYTLISGEGLGAYVVVGAGFYHKVTNFTAPQTGVECYYYCEEVEYQGNFDHYTSNAPGFNGGFGLTYKFSRFSSERLYGEVRYVFMDNSQKTGLTINNLNTIGPTYTGSNYYPANSNRTTYIPVKFGIRF